VPSEGSGSRAGHALERCVGDADRFAEQVWGRRHLHHRGGAGFDDLLTFEDVDRLLSTASLRFPLFRLVKDGTTIPTSRYTKRGRTGSTTMTGIADPRRIFQLFSDGATIVLQSLHRFWPPATQLCRELEIALGHQAQANAYITPPGARGLAVHEDSHDVFVLQAFGRKHWEVYERRHGGSHEAGGEGPVLSVELQPGECLYLPKGTPHAARAQEATSGHLTVGVLSTTWGDVLGDLWTRLRTEPAFDEPLPAGFHRDLDGLAAGLEARLAEAARWLEKVDAGQAAAEAVHAFLTSRPPMLEGVLRDSARVDELHDDSVLHRRPGSICELQPWGDRLRVLLGDRELDMPGWLHPAMEWLRTADRFRVGELVGTVGDERSRLVLARRLVREGMLGVAE
jgi:lysine-specific demethylase/histidyl-hydroxylase NO66